MSEVTRYSNPHEAVDAIYRLSTEYAQAKSSRVYLEQFRKTKKALLINECEEGTIQTRESYAYAHPEYLEVLEGLRDAVELEEEAKFKLRAAELRVEVWRTTSANERKEISATGMT